MNGNLKTTAGEIALAIKELPLYDNAALGEQHYQQLLMVSRDAEFLLMTDLSHSSMGRRQLSLSLSSLLVKQRLVHIQNFF
jgi:hypothetical protein